jgi:AraC-like DNA-binding protein
MQHTFQTSDDQFFGLTPEMGMLSFSKHEPVGYFTIIWAISGEVMLIADELPVDLVPNTMTFFTPNQHVRYAGDEGTYIALQFNREFYCTFQNDHEVSCNGLIFFSSMGTPVIQLSQEDHRRFDRLYEVLLEEFSWRDTIQGEMLRALLKRWIILATRIFKMQGFKLSYDDPNIEVIRHFNMLVEARYKELHSVAEYADLLHKSPKTLSHLFKQSNQPPPLRLIHSRIALEAKRLLLHTNKSIKEIAYELGFENTSTFSRLFKRVIRHSPQDYRTLHYQS